MNATKRLREVELDLTHVRGQIERIDEQLKRSRSAPDIRELQSDRAALLAAEQNLDDERSSLLAHA